jgi:hypothetical protein
MTRHGRSPDRFARIKRRPETQVNHLGQASAPTAGPVKHAQGAKRVPAAGLVRLLGQAEVDLVGMEHLQRPSLRRVFCTSSSASAIRSSGSTPALLR